MPRPGVEVLTRESPFPRTAPTDTGVAFVAVLTDQGPEEAVRVTSLDDFEDRFGERVSYSLSHDALDAAFREGLNSAYVSRVLGPTPVKATANVLDQAGSTVPGDVALVAKAKDYGEYGNSLNFEITVTGTDFQVIVSHDDDGVLETSPLLADRAAAVTWSESSDYVDLTLGASAEDPRAQGPTGLTTGADDRALITDAEVLVALGRFNKELGPGQVAAPGWTTAAVHGHLLDHAADTNRFALLDPPDTTEKATLLAAAAAVDSHANGRYGGLFGPWYIAPGIVPSSTRTLPPSGFLLGMIARNDAQNDPGEAVAGLNGQSVFAIDLAVTSADLDAEDYEDLNDAQINMARLIYGGIRNYGFRSLALKDDFPHYWRASDNRALMAIRNQGEIVAERFVFAQIDGQGLKLGELAGQEKGMLLAFYNEGMLYGETPEEAFDVNVSESVNPPEQLEDGVVRCVLSVRVSPFAELVRIEISKRAISEAVA